MRQILIAVFVFTLAVRPVMAIDVPVFPTCPNPGGTMVASYADGTHGIPGRSETFTGSDQVFKIDATKTVQCYCAPNGSGIQTNWWKVSSLTAEEKAELLTKGWNYIPDGSLWGLDPSDWMAQNQNLTCGEKGGGSNNSSSSSSSSDSGAGSSVSSFVASILGFADTGRQAFWQRVFVFAGLLSMASAVAVLFVRTVSKPTKKR